MIGQVHWLPFVILLVTLAPVLAFWVYGWREDRRYLVQQGSVRCRSKGNILAQCTVVRDAKSGQPIGIRRCSACANPEDVRCERACLVLFKFTTA